MLNRVNEVIERVNLSNSNSKMPSELSGGMQKRVSFASKEEAEEAKKQIYGGISPLGLSENIKIYIDQNVMSREKVFIGGGNRTTKLFLSPHSLQKISKGIVLDLAQS